MSKSEPDNLVGRNFSDLSLNWCGPEKTKQLKALQQAVVEWNSKVNLISRKDIDQLEVHHLYHSLSLAKFVPFNPGERVLDVGTGGGFPGLPLAIYYPDTKFTLIDSVGKKAKAVRDISSRLDLKNVSVVQDRIENYKEKFHFVIGRAVTAIPRFIKWTAKNLLQGGNKDRPYGILYFKGSLYKEELGSIGLTPQAVYDIQTVFNHPFFREKYILHLPTNNILNIKWPKLD